MNNELLTDIDGPMARIAFNRPEARNAVTPAMLATLHAFMARIENDAQVRCIILSGNGEHFSAGGDVAGFRATLQRTPAERRAEFLERVAAVGRFFVQFARMPQPIVARVQGAVAGAAFGMLAGADFAIAGASAKLILAQVKIGGSPDGATSYYLPRLVGARKAKELAILGQTLGAAEGLALGIFNSVVPDADLDAAVDTLVGKICAAPAGSVRSAKRLMDQSLANPLERQLQLEAEAFADCAAGDDFVEGVSAFTEKRKALFNRGA